MTAAAAAIRVRATVVRIAAAVAAAATVHVRATVIGVVLQVGRRVSVRRAAELALRVHGLARNG